MTFTRRIPHNLFLAFRITVSLGILVYLATMFDWKRVGHVLTELQVQYIWYGPLLLLASEAVMAVRWRILLRDFGITLRFSRAFRYYIVGCFYSNFLPGVIGGDVVRVGLCSKEQLAPLVDVATTALIERVFGLLMVLSIGCCGLLVLPEEFKTALGTPVITSLITIAGAAVAVVITMLVGIRYLPSGQLHETDGVRPRLMVFFRVLSIVRQIPVKVLLMVAVLSGLAQMLGIIASFFIARSIGIDLPFSLFLVVIPLVYLGTVLPISLGGLGVREGMLVALLAQVGEFSSDAVLFSFLLYLNQVVIAVVGGVAQLGTGTSATNLHEVPAVTPAHGGSKA